MIKFVGCSLFCLQAPSARVQMAIAVRNTVSANGHHIDSIEMEFDLCSRLLILFRSDVINHDQMRHHRCTRRREQSETHTHTPVPLVEDMKRNQKNFRSRYASVCFFSADDRSRIKCAFIRCVAPWLSTFFLPFVHVDSWPISLLLCTRSRMRMRLRCRCGLCLRCSNPIYAFTKRTEYQCSGSLERIMQ